MRERVYRTEAVIIRRSDFGEADRLLTLITPMGKRRVVAKGARKTTSRLAGHIELFTHAGLLLAVVNAVVRFYRGLPTGALGLPTNTLHWMGLGLVMLSWVIFVAGSSNILHFGQYLRRVGLITPAALMVCLLLGDVMLLLALIEATK